MGDQTETKPAGGGGGRKRPSDRQLKPTTQMMGLGYDPALSEGALKPPIFLTSTFAFKSAADGKRHFQALADGRAGGPEGLIYSRFNGPDQEILEDRLSVWDGGEDALCFSSGMAAIATVLLAHARPGDVIVHSAPLYAATEKLIGTVLGRLGVTWRDFPAGAQPDRIEQALSQAKREGRVPIVMLESPANPTNTLVDIEAVRAACDSVFGGPETSEGRPLIVVDNTFLGPLWQQPLRNGADLVVYSLTKYVGGHSDLVAGAVVGNRAAIGPIRALRNTIGTITDPHTAWLLLRSLETLELRMSRAGDNAAKVCAFLRTHPKVESVGYLGFLAEQGGSQADIFRRHCSGSGSTFSLYLKGGEAQSFAFLDCASDRQARRQPWRHRDARQPPCRDDASIGRAFTSGGTGHQRQSGARLHRHRGRRRPHRRFRPGAGCGLTSQPTERASFKRHSGQLLGRADGERCLDAGHVGRGGQLRGQELLEALQVPAHDLEDEIDLAIEHVALAHLGQGAHVLLELAQRLLRLALEAHEREDGDGEAQLGGVEIGVIAPDHALFFKRAHASQTWRRGQPDAFGKLDVGDSPLMLKFRQQPPIDPVQMRHAVARLDLARARRVIPANVTRRHERLLLPEVILDKCNVRSRFSRLPVDRAPATGRMSQCSLVNRGL